MPQGDAYATPGLERGFVFAASGHGYTPIAINAARSLRAVCPHEQIDLFTDVAVEGETPFDRVHHVEKQWFRPKFEALRRSRFDLTVYLDNDMVFLADISDVFPVLARHDAIAVHTEVRGSSYGTGIWRSSDLPPAFPQVNGGLLGIRRSEATHRFICDVERALAEYDLPKDQPVLRELLWESGLSLAILPFEYNMMHFEHLDGLRGQLCAPRVLHLRALQAHMRDEIDPETSLRSILGVKRLRKLQRLLDRDLTLEGRARKTVYRATLQDRLRSRVRRGLKRRLRWK